MKTTKQYNELEQVIINSMPVQDDKKVELFQELRAINEFVYKTCHVPLNREHVNIYKDLRTEILSNHKQLTCKGYNMARKIVRDYEK